jgi:hypothetical protein
MFSVQRKDEKHKFFFFRLILILENLIDGQGELDVKTFGLSLIKWAYAGFSELGFDFLLSFTFIFIFIFIFANL